MKETLLFENFQILNYYLSNLLLSLLPLLELSTRFKVVSEGRFSHLDDPLKALRYDAMVRNMSLHTFLELRTVVLKLIHSLYTVQAEKLFDATIEHCGGSQMLQVLEESVVQGQILRGQDLIIR